MKKHVHEWEHIEAEGKNLNDLKCNWLIHKCKLCKQMTEPVRIFDEFP